MGMGSWPSGVSNLWLLHDNGTLDASFGSGGKVTTEFAEAVFGPASHSQGRMRRGRNNEGSRFWFGLTDSI